MTEEKGEPMYLISESEYEILSYEGLETLAYKRERERIKCAIRARGPVEQAPANDYCIHLKWLTQIEGDGDYRCDLGNKTSCEWCEGKGRCGDYQSARDAALIAQEREKLEQRLLLKSIPKQLIDYCDNNVCMHKGKSKPWCVPEECNYLKSEAIRKRIVCDASIAAQARENARKEAIWELLKHFKFACPGGEITPICDMCSANPYCIELRNGQEQEI